MSSFADVLTAASTRCATLQADIDTATQALAAMAAEKAALDKFAAEASALSAESIATFNDLAGKISTSTGETS